MLENLFGRPGPFGGRERWANQMDSVWEGGEGVGAGGNRLHNFAEVEGLVASD